MDVTLGGLLKDLDRVCVWDKLLVMEMWRWFGGQDVQGRWHGKEG